MVRPQSINKTGPWSARGSSCRGVSLSNFRFAMSSGAVFLVLSIALSAISLSWGLSFSSSSFHGTRVIHSPTMNNNQAAAGISNLVMRKQKASDKRTARRQRGIIDDNNSNADGTATFTPPPLSTSSSATQILNSSPMTKSQWKDKKIEMRAAGVGGNNNVNNGGGRGRARKRLKLYNSLASYHSTFLELISEEYQMEVSQAW